MNSAACAQLVGGVAILLFFFAWTTPARAATFAGTYEVHGYAWSDTIGWVSFNCDSDPGTCGAVDYKVVINPDLTLTGWAWSDNIGWIKFGGMNVNSTPAVNAAGRKNATIVLDGPYIARVYGWVRACAGTQSGDCSTMTNRGDGWDGWISFNCTDWNGSCNNIRNYSVLVGNGTLSGYAWGSEVVGWLKMINVTFDQPCAPSNTCELDWSGYDSVTQWCETPNTACEAGYYCLNDATLCELVDISDFTFDAPAIVRSGSSADVSWSITNPTEVDSCTVTGSNGESWTGISNTVTTINLVRPVTTYTLECVAAGAGPTIRAGSIDIMTLPVIIES